MCSWSSSSEQLWKLCRSNSTEAFCGREEAIADRISGRELGKDERQEIDDEMEKHNSVIFQRLTIIYL